jgi:hypothetical protein
MKSNKRSNDAKDDYIQKKKKIDNVDEGLLTFQTCSTRNVRIRMKKWKKKKL